MEATISVFDQAFGQKIVLEAFHLPASFIDMDALYDPAGHPRIVQLVTGSAGKRVDHAGALNEIFRGVGVGNVGVISAHRAADRFGAIVASGTLGLPGTSVAQVLHRQRRGGWQ
jgi:hypothetical protein